MDFYDKLILLRKQGSNYFEDVTKNTTSIKLYKGYYCITLHETSYNKKIKDIKILNYVKDEDLANNIICYQGKIKSDIERLAFYSDNNNSWYKIFCKNGFVTACSKENIKIIKYNKADKSLLNYWYQCANQTKQSEIKNILCTQYSKIHYFEKDSVLYHYVNQTNEINEFTKNLICPFDFNKTQISAIKNALHNKISIIKGPPGTGKTQTILNLICNLIINDKSVAIVASTNSAIENIEEKLQNKGYNNLIASLGNGIKKASFFSQKVEVEKRLQEKTPKIEVEKLELLLKLFESENKSKLLIDESNKLKLEKEYYEKYFKNTININTNKYHFKNSEDLINYTTNYQKDTNNKNFTIFLWLKLIFKYGFKKSLIKVKNRDELLSALEYQFYILKSNELDNEIKLITDNLKNLDIKNLIEQYKNISKNILDNYISTNINFNETFSLHDYKKRFTNFIKRYPIITTTTLSFMSSIKSDFLFDYVVIDESSQVSIPSTIPLLNKCKNIVIVGDDKQLQPIQENYLIKCPASSSYNCNNNSLINSFMSIYPQFTITLLEHYRCNPSIIGFCNLKYYDNLLIPFTSEDNIITPLILYSTVSGNHMRKIYNGNENGVYNQREIDTIEEILNCNLIIKNEDCKKAIISPYRLQVEKLKHKFNNIECDTVHKFQGREKDLIIFSPVLDEKMNNKDMEFVDNPNLINVTVSRAIKQFVLVADKNLYEHKGKEIHDLINYIAYKTKNENVLKSKTISIFDYLYKEKEIQRNKILTKSSSKSQYNSERLLRYVIDDLILKNERYKQFVVQEQVKLKDIIFNFENFNDEEIKYINNNCSVDFLIKDKVNQDIICLIEVDGIAFHENNLVQQQKDNMKDNILNKYNLKLLRLKTNGSNEKIKINEIFDGYINKFTQI